MANILTVSFTLSVPTIDISESFNVKSGIFGISLTFICLFAMLFVMFDSSGVGSIAMGLL